MRKGLIYEEHNRTRKHRQTTGAERQKQPTGAEKRKQAHDRYVCGGTGSRILHARGMQILARNYRCRQGEIDLIARDGRYLVLWK